MLKISHASVAGLTEAQRQRFVADHLPVLRQEFPELWFERTYEEIGRMLYDHCAWASRHQVERSRGIYLLLTMRLRLGWEFPAREEDAWARTILGRELRPEDERIDALHQALWGEGVS